MKLNDKSAALDKLLDIGLRQFGQADPRPGLEGRILANLQAADARLSHLGRWWPALAALSAVLLVGMAVLAGRERRGNATVQAPVLQASKPLPQFAQVPNAAVTRPALKPQRMAGLKQPIQEANAVEPRLEQFPSPQPLSEQEKLLANYVRERPQEAGLVARARQQLRQEALLEMEKQNHVPEHSQEFEQ